MEDNKSKIILVGGGGHCKSCIDVIETSGKFKIIGIIDFPHLLNKETMGYKVIGNDDDLPKLAQEGFSFLITLGHMGDPKRRIELYSIIKENGGNLPPVISSHAYVSNHAIIGPGTIVMHSCTVNSHAKIGDNCILNSKSLVEHETTIESNCHISTGAIINGDCQINENTFIGSGSIIKNGLSISTNSIIGSGSNVITDIIDPGTYIGNPAKKASTK